jgi:hypothetical protein
VLFARTTQPSIIGVGRRQALSPHDPETCLRAGSSHSWLGLTRDILRIAQPACPESYPHRGRNMVADLGYSACSPNGFELVSPP